MTQVGILSRPSGDAVRETERFGPLIAALRARGLEVNFIPFAEESIEEVRRQLLQQQAVLVWVDPLTAGRDRGQLDPLLRDVASNRVWVTTHPDIILKLGTKGVLVSTRRMPWGADSYSYRSIDEMRQQLPERLRSGPRVLKQLRGNGGNGTWKVRAASPEVTRESAVRVLHAERNSRIEEMPLSKFIERCLPYFAGGGGMVDQPFQARLSEGMIRCYLVGDRVAGFGHQFVTALMDLPDGELDVPAPAPRLYYGPDKPEFQRIKTLLEHGWVRQLQETLGVETDQLPALWDADFLYGPKDAEGRDTYVLCEINVSSVSPFPAEAVDTLADYVGKRLSAR